jgi:hypothetical protein
MRDEKELKFGWKAEKDRRGGHFLVLESYIFCVVFQVLVVTK